MRSFKEIMMDYFAGGGGASTAMKMATGSGPYIAANHDPAAIAMHRANHPSTLHYQEDVWDIDPIAAANGYRIGFVWFSPDCRDFTKAKGGKPVSKRVRSLAWVVIKCCGKTNLRVGILENVEEFAEWGPLIAKRDPKTKRVLKLDGSVAEPGEVVPVAQQQLVRDPKRKGKTFRAFVRSLEALGYEVEWKLITASDYGAATARTRLYMAFRNDGKPIVWPEPTHAHRKSLAVKMGEKQPYVPAATHIDWSLPCKSIFNRDKSLVEKTMRRIALGMGKFVINADEPYILTPEQANQSWIKQHRSVGRDNTTKVAAFLSSYYGSTNEKEVRGSDLNDPLHTITAGGNRFALVTSFLTKFRGNNIGTSLSDPLPTVTAGGNHFGQVYAFLTTYYGQSVGQSIHDPLGTIVTKDRFGLILVYVDGVAYEVVDICMRMLSPRELFNAQGFPSSYIIDYFQGFKKVKQSDQVARVGNSVSPPPAAALIRANVPELSIHSDRLIVPNHVNDVPYQLGFAF